MATRTRKPKPALSVPTDVTPGQLAVKIGGAIDKEPAVVGKQIRRRLRAMVANGDLTVDRNKGDRWTVPAKVASAIHDSMTSK